MDSFVFALDTTMPVFLVILLGWFLRRVGILNEGFCKPADQYGIQMRASGQLVSLHREDGCIQRF